MKRKILSILVFVLILTGCSSSRKNGSYWVNIAKDDVEKSYLIDFDWDNNSAKMLEIDSTKDQEIITFYQSQPEKSLILADINKEYTALLIEETKPFAIVTKDMEMVLEESILAQYQPDKFEAVISALDKRAKDSDLKLEVQVGEFEEMKQEHEKIARELLKIETLNFNETLYIGERENRYNFRELLTSAPSDTPVSRLTWTSSDETVATVDDQGIVYSHHPGETTISVYDQYNTSASVQFKIKANQAEIDAYQRMRTDDYYRTFSVMFMLEGNFENAEALAKSERLVELVAHMQSFETFKEMWVSPDQVCNASTPCDLSGEGVRNMLKVYFDIQTIDLNILTGRYGGSEGKYNESKDILNIIPGGIGGLSITDETTITNIDIGEVLISTKLFDNFMDSKLSYETTLHIRENLDGTITVLSYRKTQQ